VLGMVRLCIVALLLSFGMVLVGSISKAFAQEEVNCDALRKDLVFKRQQLSQHVEALKKLNEQNELTVMAVFNDKIRELIDDIQKIEMSERRCVRGEPTRNVPGLDTVKSEVGDYATKSCDQLRTLLLQLVQKTAALKRREGSLFSSLTQAEKNEIQEADNSFKELKAAIKSRCASEDSRSPIRGRPR
jgi:hypothetical protein